MLSRRCTLAASRLATRLMSTAAASSSSSGNSARLRRARAQQSRESPPFVDLLRQAQTLEKEDGFDELVTDLKERAEQELGRPVQPSEFPVLKIVDERRRKDLGIEPTSQRQEDEDEAFFRPADMRRVQNELENEYDDYEHALDHAAPYGIQDPDESTSKRFLRGAHNFENIPGQEDPSGGSLGFKITAIQRQWLHYMRLIEGDMFMLQGLREDFVPPTSDLPLVVKTVHYNGERHPVTRKRTLTVPVALLPLRDEVAIHKFKLLAGPRWTQRPPTDGGVGESEIEVWGNEGYFKMAVEDLAEPIQNLKFGSDVLDRLIETANDTQKDDMTDIPLDERHVAAVFRRKPKWDRFGHRNSSNDFPVEWLHLDAKEYKDLLAEHAFEEREMERGEHYSFDKKDALQQRYVDKRAWMDTLGDEERKVVEALEKNSDEFDLYHDVKRFKKGKMSNLGLPPTEEEIYALLEEYKNQPDPPPSFDAEDEETWEDDEEGQDEDGEDSEENDDDNDEGDSDDGEESDEDEPAAVQRRRPKPGSRSS